ncbi:MAG: hypothetical protein V2J12_13365, partial [Gammaproteobacteria bacterium]|nr:hypothetical protein [Gammaproteobacteria bacterium]
MSAQPHAHRSARLRLATRSSLLGVAQTRQVAAALAASAPGLQVDIVCYSSPGDRDQDTPLPDVAAADFFSADVDAALLNGAVDACVHSWKDITGARPAGVLHAATPRRAAPHDVVLFRPDIRARLDSGEPLRIGTCSVRRSLNVGDFLATALPESPGRERLQFVPVRGPVDARLASLSAAAGEPRLDGLVLALAGLQRLFADPDGHAAVAALLASLRWMVLPLSACPAAPAQGALAVECRADDASTRRLLAGIHDAVTHATVSLELARAEQLGAARDRFGITTLPVPELRHVTWLRGRNADGSARSGVVSGAVRPPPATPVRPWTGSLAGGQRAEPVPGARVTSRDVFLAHADALQDLQLPATARIWTSGVRSWQRLADRGVWVEGCGDNLGFAQLRALLATPVLQLQPLEQWTAVTHVDAVEGWAGSGIGTVVASYRLPPVAAEHHDHEELSSATHFYWDSARQYRALRGLLPRAAQHACGAGKTLQALRAAGLQDVVPFVSRR